MVNRVDSKRIIVNYYRVGLPFGVLGLAVLEIYSVYFTLNMARVTEMKVCKETFIGIWKEYRKIRSTRDTAAENKEVAAAVWIFLKAGLYLLGIVMIARFGLHFLGI